MQLAWLSLSTYDVSAIYTCGRDTTRCLVSLHHATLNTTKIYDHVLQPVVGKVSWPVSENPKPHPPRHRIMPGRKETKRRKEEGEKKKKWKADKEGL